MQDFENTQEPKIGLTANKVGQINSFNKLDCHELKTNADLRQINSQRFTNNGFQN